MSKNITSKEEDEPVEISEWSKKYATSSINLEIARSAFKLHNYTRGLSPTLERALSVYDYIEKRYTHILYDIDDEKKILLTPNGFDINWILDKLLSDHITVDKIVNNFTTFTKPRRVDKVKCNMVPRNTIQSDAIKFIIGDDSSDKHRSHRLIALATGFGKTVIAIKGAIELKVPTVVISENLSKQWSDRIHSFTDCGENDLRHITTWEIADKIIKSDKEEIATFYVVGLDCAIAMLNRDPTMLQRFYDKIGVGLEIFDEMHRSFLKTIRILCSTNVERILYLSATPMRSNRNQDISFRRIFRNSVPTFGEQTHTHNKYNIVFLTHKTKPGPNELFRIETRRGFSAIEYCKYLFRYPKRIEQVFIIIEFFVKRIYKFFNYDMSKKVIIFVQSLDGINTLKHLIEKYLILENGENVTVGNYSGNVKKNDRHEELESNVILSTMANSAGLDLQGLVLIINFIPLSSEVMIRQMVGRLRAMEGYFVDVTDSGFVGAMRQQTIRKAILRKNARTIDYMEYDNKAIVRVGGKGE